MFQLRKLALVGMLFLTVPAVGQVGNAQSPNAALRYWMAFALLRDVPADATTNPLIEGVLAGTLQWDETRLGSFIDQNTEAILTMHRASSLPDCDWGLEYELGPQAPVAHLARARALARLNVLYGIRMLAQRDTAKAVEAWLAGIRFAQHLAQNAPLVSVLTAKTGLVSALHTINKAVESGSLDGASIVKLQDAVRSLPAAGLDWSRSARVEANATELGLAQFAVSRNQADLYNNWFGESMPSSYAAPTQADLAEYRFVMNQTAAAFQLPYDSTKRELAAMQTRIARLNPIIRQTIPNLARINDARRELEIGRDRLLNTLTPSPRR